MTWKLICHSLVIKYHYYVAHNLISCLAFYQSVWFHGSSNSSKCFSVITPPESWGALTKRFQEIAVKTSLSVLPLPVHKSQREPAMSPNRQQFSEIKPKKEPKQAWRRTQLDAEPCICFTTCWINLIYLLSLWSTLVLTKITNCCGSSVFGLRC